MDTLTKEQQEVLDKLNQGVSCFLTGNGGAGKSYLIQQFIKHSKKKILVTATTGIAACNIGGCTIFSGLGLKTRSVYVQKQWESLLINKSFTENIIKNIDCLIIDEASMLRVDFFAMLDQLFRKIRGKDEFFGGCQLILVGDVIQLEPVTKTAPDLFHNSKEWIKQYYNDEPFFFGYTPALNLPVLKLTHIFRQSDKYFIGLLENIRYKYNLSQTLNELNKRVIHYDFIEDQDNTIIICGTNKVAQQYNIMKREALPFSNPEMTYIADISGNLSKQDYPMEEELTIKVGAKVMVLVNKPDLKVNNGTIGIVKSLTEDSVTITVTDPMTKQARDVKLEPHEFKIQIPISASPDSVTYKTISFVQIPLREAWAITVHKSQGQTFEKVHLDLDKAFAHGQVYTALSRCKSLEGLTLEHPLKETDIIVRQSTIDYMKGVN